MATLFGERHKITPTPWFGSHEVIFCGGLHYYNATEYTQLSNH